MVKLRSMVSKNGKELSRVLEIGKGILLTTVLNKLGPPNTLNVSEG